MELNAIGSVPERDASLTYKKFDKIHANSYGTLKRMQ